MPRLYVEYTVSEEVEQEDHALEVVIDNETAEFDKYFEEIDGGLGELPPMQYLNNKQVEPEFYGGASFTAYTLGSIGLAMALGVQGASIPPILPMVWAGGFIGAYSIGKSAGNKINNLGYDFDQNFEGEYRQVEDFDEVEKLLSKSDAVKYDETQGLGWSSTVPTPETATRDYRQLIRSLEEAHSYWEDERDSMIDEFLSASERQIVNSYTPEEDETDLVDIANLEHIQESRRERAREIQNRLRETEINQYLRLKEVNNDVYEGHLCRFEIYQGEDLQFVVDSLTDQDISEIGVEAEFVNAIG